MNTKHKKPGYVKLTFTDETLTELDAIIRAQLLEGDLYFSEVIEHISGNVAKKAHLTLFYGIDPEFKDSVELKNYVKSLDIKKLDTGKIKIMSGYQDQYKILHLEIKDTDNKLKEIHDELAKYNTDKSLIHSSFKPHITLAYLNNNCRVTDIDLGDVSLKIDEVLLNM